jgi:hypothetical protein
MLVLLPLFSASVSAQDSAPVEAGTAAQANYPDAVAGMQSQMDELIRVIRSSDEKTFLAALDMLAIPKPHDWFAAHFPDYGVDELQRDYELAFAGYRSHVWWVMGNFAKDPSFGVRAEVSELPNSLAETGFEALLPKPDREVTVENYRISPLSPQPPSWVSSFIYIDGRFRFVGGTYPFWNERLTPLRGPMAIPAKTLGDLAVQGVPFEVDSKTPGVVAIVVLDVKIGSDGRAHGFKVQSGGPPYVKQAEEYVSDWQFFPIATTLSLNVVFFNARH